MSDRPADPIAAAMAAIDAAHAADPELRDGRPAELAYAEAMTQWTERLQPAPGPALRLAARAQHLERWTLPRSAYSMDRPGYHAWRIAQYARQAARARELCLGAGVDPAIAERAALLVAKKLPRDPEGQALEDAACLVFLEREIGSFAAEHPDYTADKVVDILRKTARKMSAQARTFAAALPMAEPLRALLLRACAGL